MLSNYMSPFDATVVERSLHQAQSASANLVATSLQWVPQTKTVPLAMFKSLG